MASDSSDDLVARVGAARLRRGISLPEAREKKRVRLASAPDYDTGSQGSPDSMALNGTQRNSLGTPSQNQRSSAHNGTLAANIDVRRLLLPFKADTVLWAWEFNARQLNQEQGTGIWHSDVFWFAWLIKGHEDMLAIKDGNVALMLVRKALCAGGNSQHELCVDEDLQAQFADCFEQIRSPAGSTPIHMAIARASRQVVEPPRERTPGYTHFVSVAAWLQAGRGHRPIVLPVRALASALGRQPNTICAYRKWAVQDGLLMRVCEHQFSPVKGRSKADEFVFALHRFPRLREKFSFVPHLEWFEDRFGAPAGLTARPSESP